MNATLRVRVSPYRDGEVPASLIGLAPKARLGLSGQKPPPLPKSIGLVELMTSTISLTTAVDLGFTSVASMKTSGRSVMLLGEFFAHADPIPGKEGSLIKQEHYGVGFRLCVKAWNLDSTDDASLAGVAAACTVGAAASAYEVRVLGVEPAGLDAAGPFIAGTVSGFDASAMTAIGVLQSSLEQVIFKGGSAISPVLLAVDLDLDLVAEHKALFSAASTCYALQAICHKEVSLRDALDDRNLPSLDFPSMPGLSINREIVRTIYQKIVGHDPTAKPNLDAQKKARAALFDWKLIE